MPVVLTIALVACAGSSSSPAPDHSLAIQGAAGTSTIPEPPPDTGPAGTAPADTGPDDDEAEPARPRNETPLAAGAYRTDVVVGPIVPIDFELPVDDLYTLSEEGFLGVTADAAGDSTLVSVTAVDNTIAFSTPTVDFANLVDQSYMDSISEPTPADLLTWLAGRPGVTAGPITETTVAGHTARSMTYSIGPFEGAAPCGAGDRDCAATLFAPITGLGQLYFVGDSGTLSELIVAGHRFSVDVNDVPNAAAIADSLQFTEVPPSTVPSDAVPVPFEGPHEGGVTYYSERSSGGVYLFDGFEGISTSDSFLRTSQLRLEADSTTCMVITDVSGASWRGIPASDSPPTVAPPMPQNLVEALIALPGVTVVAPPSDVTLGDVAGTSVDVTATDGEIAVLDRALGVAPGVTTRFVQLTRPDDQGFDLISVVLGSPCELVLETIRLVPSGRG